jgi:phosphate-selective porin OprO and OprP
MNIGGWLQPRYEFTSRQDAEDLNSFYIRRLRLDVRGHVLSPNLTFRLMPEFARTANLRDGWINYAFTPEMQVRAGQFTVPFQWHRFVGPRRQHFAERGVPSETFGFPTGRDAGIMLHGQNAARTWNYGLGVFDGAGRNVQFSNSSGLLLSGRLGVAALGQVPTDETDYRANITQPNLAFGAGVQAAQKNEVRAWDLGRSETRDRRANWVSGTLDTQFRYRGFSAAAEGYLRRVNPRDGAVGSYTGRAFMLTSGYAIVPDQYEVVGRFSRLRHDVNDPNTTEEEWGVGLNIYHQAHDWKTRINYLNHSGFGFRTGTVIVEHHLQF